MLPLGLVVLLILFFTGVPMYVAFASGGTILHLFYCDAPLITMVSYMVHALDSWTLMAVPFFILCGELMARSRLSKELVDFCDSWVGWLPGGLAISLVLATVIFGAISGSGIAAIAAIGLIMVPRMLELGYPKGFTIGLSAASAQLGVLIPPSIPLILFSSLTETSVPGLFAAGVVPGLMLATMMIIVSVIFATRGHWPRSRVFTWHERWTAFVKAIPALFMPVLILGGIYGGIFSPTEAALVATFYCLIFGLASRRLDWKVTMEASISMARISGIIFLLVATTVVFGKVMIYARVPHMITTWVAEAGLSLGLFLSVIALLYLVIGCFAEVIIITLVTVPILFPVTTAMGIHPYAFAIIMTMGVVVAGITPPVGVNIYTASGVYNVPAASVIKNIWPFLIVEIICLFIVAHVPALSTGLPGLLGL